MMWIKIKEANNLSNNYFLSGIKSDNTDDILFNFK